MIGWNRFIAQFKKDLKQWLYFMLTLFLFRLVFILYFRDKIGKTTAALDILKAVVNGMRYDAMASSYWTLFPFLLTVTCAFRDLQSLSNRVRYLFGMAFTLLSVVLFVITITYFKEYNDHFNHFIFNLYYDDTRAILSTIWTEYHVIPSLIIMFVASYLMVVLYRRYVQSVFFLKGDDVKEKRALPFLVRIALSMLICSTLIIGLRGSYGIVPAKLKDAGVTQDAFLNKAVMNPYIALHYAYGDHRKMGFTASGVEAYLPDRNIRGAAQALFENPETLDNLDLYMKKIARGTGHKAPRHIFLVIMESYDAWPLLKKYRSLGLTNELQGLAQNGLHFTNFLPASDGTDTSLGAVITGLPDASVKTQYQRSSRTPYPTAIAGAFKRLGYTTRFFYGGYLSWQRIGDFVRDQGFEEIYGAPHMGSWITSNEWGVEDEHLFDFIVRTVEKNPERPSFNLIMTTSYHPPYKLDVRGKGFPLTRVPDDIAPLFDNSISLNMLGHLWYSDRCIGDFVRKAEHTFPDTLFAFSGDHYGRKFINLHPDFFESSAVPFILYGKNTLRNVKMPAEAAGSHIDIGPTLIELAAPKGFPYYSIGQNLLQRRTRPWGAGRGKVIGPDFIYDVSADALYPLPGKELPRQPPDRATLKTFHDRLHGLAWWRIMRGAIWQ